MILGQVVILCLLGGCSICWFNTVCHVLCIKNFPTSRPLALSLSVSFNGVSAALYTLIANAINPNDDTLYLLLNALVPLFTSTVTLIPVLLRQLPLQPINSSDGAIPRDSLVFLILYILAAFTGLYLLFLNSISSTLDRAHLLLLGAIILLLLPLCLPVIAYAWEWSRPSIHYASRLKNSTFIDPEDDELYKELIGKDTAAAPACTTSYGVLAIDKEGYFGKVIMGKDRLTILGEEHQAGVLVHRLDFWLYFVSYFCGGTLGLVYSNNLGQISQSLGYTSHTSSLVMLYSSCSFFGRLLSAAPDFLHEYVFIIIDTLGLVVHV